MKIKKQIFVEGQISVTLKTSYTKVRTQYEYLEKYGIQLSVFKVMNRMKFRVAVWKVWIFPSFVKICFGCAKLFNASIFFMQFDEKFICILLKLIEIEY